MCGIGAISLSPSSTIPIRQLAHELLLHSEERGKVASGFAFHYAGENKYVKDALPGGHLPLKLLPRDSRTVILHTRNATYGNPEENDNNHPVVDDKEEILLVHNGVITNHLAIREGEKDVVFPEVDSSVIPWLIRQEGVAGLQHLDGWAALAWLDKAEPGILNLARVQGAAPMVVVYLDDGSVVMGSTFPIIHASLIRVGYGDRIVGGYEVPDLTHLQVKAGSIGLMSNVPKYVEFKAKYKGKVMTYAEKQRLEKITNGDAVSYGKDTPQHAPSTAVTPVPGSTSKSPPVGSSFASGSPTPASLASAGVTPAAVHGAGYVSPYVSTSKGPTTTPPVSSYHSPKAPEGYKKGDDPMAAFKANAAKNPPPKEWSGSSSVTKPNDGRTVAARERHPIPMYLEQRLRYWITWSSKPNSRETDIFFPSDLAEDDGYLYNIFSEMVEDGWRRGTVEKWGVFDHEGVARWTSDFRTAEEEVNALIAIAKQLPGAPKRKVPKGAAAPSAGLNGVSGDDALVEAIIEEADEIGDTFRDEDGLIHYRTKDGFKPMWRMSSAEWAEVFEGYDGLN